MAFGLHRLFGRRQAAWWTLVAGLGLTAALGWEMHREAVALDRQRMEMRVAEITAQLDARIEKSEMMLHNLRDYLMLSGEERNEVFNRWCYENGLTINCKWIHGILVATNKQLASWPEGVPISPRTWTADDWGRFDSFARAHRIECDIALSSSVTNTKRFLTDYDLRGSLGEKKWFSRIVSNSRLGMSEHQTVMLDTNNNAIAGTLFQVPIYKPEMAGLTADLAAAGFTKPGERARMRWLHLVAVIVAPVDFEQLVQSIWRDAPADIGIELFSSTNQTAETCLNHSVDVPRAVDPAFKAYLTRRQHWPMYGQKFSIFFHTTPLFDAQSPRRLAKVAMAAGATLTLLATALVGVATRARTQQEYLTEQIREARDALAAAQREREKFSRDLHDGTIQSLYAIQLGLGHTVEKLKADPAHAQSELSAVRRELDAVIAEIRQFITAEAGTGKRVDFSAVLTALVQRVRNGTTAEIALHCDPGMSERLTGDQAVQLANIAREALSNSLRHAKPQRVQIALRSDRETVVLEISDDGTGFDPTAPRRSGVGLTSIAARTQEMRGKVDIQSAPDKGTRVVVRVPAAPLEPKEAEGPDDSTGES
jgi:signal transduction histidine kinase